MQDAITTEYQKGFELFRGSVQDGMACLVPIFTKVLSNPFING